MVDYDPNFWERFFWIIKYPDSINLTTIIHTVILFAMALLVIYHGYKKYGVRKVLIFFSGGFLFSGLEENIFMLAGYSLKGTVIGGTEIPMTYYFNYHGYIFWYMGIPLISVLGWFIITYTTVHMTQKLTKGFFKPALLAGFVGMSLDLIIDPIMIRRFNWIWLAELDQSFWVLQVPISNFIGWFLLIFAFNWIYFWYHDKFLVKRENWGAVKKTLVFYLFMFTVLILIVIVLVTVTIAFTPLYGIDISWWPWPT